MEHQQKGKSLSQKSSLVLTFLCSLSFPFLFSLFILFSWNEIVFLSRMANYLVQLLNFLDANGEAH